MPDNPKSIALLAGTQIMKSFASLNQSINLCESKQKEYNQTLINVECFQSTVKNLEEDISINISKDRKLKLEEIRLRS
jgi:hypothetical protein